MGSVTGGPRARQPGKNYARTPGGRRIHAPGEAPAGSVPFDNVGVYAYSHRMVVRLRGWRERRGLSLRALADVAGVAWSTLHRVESGRVSPTVALLEKVAAALDIGIRDFFPPPDPGRRTTRR